jgi:hypothetical protein
MQYLSKVMSTPISERRADILSFAFLLLLPLIFFWRETLGYFTLGNADAIFYFFPLWKVAFEQIKDGQLPLWNPYYYSGMALFAQWTPGLLDPLNWIHLLGPNSRTLTLANLASFSVALLGMYGFARHLGMAPRASIVSAVIYGLSGYVVARVIYTGIFHIYALTPLILLYVERLYQTGYWRYAVYGGLIVAWQIFAGHPQPFVYSSLLAAAYALFCAFLRRDQYLQVETEKMPAEEKLLPFASGARFRFLIRCALMFVLGVALSAVQLIPAWEMGSQSVRQRVTYEFFGGNSLHPITLLTTIFPFFFGGGKTIYDLPFWGGHIYWGPNEIQIYLGVLAISLAISAALCLWRERSRIILFWSIILIVACLLVLGRYVGPLAWVIYQIPMFNQFRSPNRHWMEVVLATAVLAGYAVNQILRGGAQAIARVAQIMALGLTLITVMVGGFILWRRDQAEALIRGLPDMYVLPQGFLQQAGAELYLPIISSICLLLALLVFVRTKRHNRWYLLLLSTLIIDFNLYATFATINTGKLELGESASAVGQAVPPELVARQSERNPIRYHLFVNSMENYFDPYGFYGHEMATGHDPIINARYKTFSGINEAGRSTLPTLLDAQDRTLDLLNVNYLLIPKLVLDASIIPSERVEYGGITFTKDRSLPMELRSGENARFYSDAAPGDTLAIVSTIYNSINVADGDEVAEILVGCDSGERVITMLQAGRDTAEWAYDRPDVRTQVRHSRAPLAASSPGDAAGSFQTHSYLARLSLPPGVASCGRSRFIKITSKAPGNVVISLNNIALYDSTTGVSTPPVKTINGSLRDSGRWREVSVRNPELRAYENLRVLPRVWLVNRVEPRLDQEQLQLIRGEMGETHERAFDPRETALIDPADATKLDRSLLDYADKRYGAPGSEGPSEAINIVEREPTRMIIDADVTRPSLLVMSEISFPGWRAKVDGRETELLRVNYMLRGIGLTSGKHVIDIFYRPRSLIIGGAISGSTVLFLFVMFALWRFDFLPHRNGKALSLFLSI